MNGKFPKLDSFFMQFKPMLLRRKEDVLSSVYSEVGIFYLKQGYVRFYTVSGEGDEMTLYIFSPNSCFPLWLIDSKYSGYYFETLTPSEVYYCDRSKLDQFLSKNLDVNLEIMQQLSQFSASIIKKIEYKIFGSAYQQVIATILDLAECFGQKDKEETTIVYWFTHQDIANIVSLSRERVTMEINNLMKKKLISYNNHFIIIPKLELLRSEAIKKDP